MTFPGRRWLIALASGLAGAAWSGAALSDPLFDPIEAINRPLTLPAHILNVSGAGLARHLEDGEVIVFSTLDAAYGITDRFQVDLSAVNVEYTPTTRLLPPAAGATYAFLDQRPVEMGVRLSIGGVLSPAPGALLEPSLPIRLAFGSRVRIDLGPEFPIVIAPHPIVGLVVPFGVTVRLTTVLYGHFDTEAELADVTARSIVVPAKLSLELGMHIKKVPLAFTPFFGFPTLFTPGDIHPHVHPGDYAGGLGVGTWFRL
jgi:hypothetical protein